jgi:hypothetical protein
LPVTRRYTPEHAPGETCSFGLDYSFIVPVGVGLEYGALGIWTNANPSVDVTDTWTVGPVEVRGRAIYATLSGGVNGVDYLLKWTATDTQGNVWPRTTLVLCAETS